MARITTATIKEKKRRQERITMLTAYDYSMATMVDQAGIDMILVGDSLGNVMLGYENTLAVTMDDMVHHTKTVSRAAKNGRDSISPTVPPISLIITSGCISSSMKVTRSLISLVICGMTWTVCPR
jgi:hypothetical protein